MSSNHPSAQIAPPPSRGGSTAAWNEHPRQNQNMVSAPSTSNYAATPRPRVRNSKSRTGGSPLPPTANTLRHRTRRSSPRQAQNERDTSPLPLTTLVPAASLHRLRAYI